MNRGAFFVCSSDERRVYETKMYQNPVHGSLGDDGGESASADSLGGVFSQLQKSVHHRKREDAQL